MTTTDRPTIAIVNHSALDAAHVAQAASALRIQVAEHFAPAWGRSANVIAEQRPPADAWQLVLLDDADQANALGYHDLTAAGLPLGKVFAKTTMSAGLSWTVTASHELLEMLGDPDINISAEVDDGSGSGPMTKFLAYEVCDACEDDSFGYSIGGILVSDFVLPSWFISSGRAPYDYGGHIRKPLELLRGGYIGVLTVGSSSGWQQIEADLDSRFADGLMRLGLIEQSRGEYPNIRSLERLAQRNKPRSRWKRSESVMAKGIE